MLEGNCLQRGQALTKDCIRLAGRRSERGALSLDITEQEAEGSVDLVDLLLGSTTKMASHNGTRQGFVPAVACLGLLKSEQLSHDLL